MPRIIMFPQDSAKRSEGCRGAQKAVARTFGVVITVLALWLICSSSAQAWGISLDTLSALMEQDTLNRMMAEQERLRNIDADTTLSRLLPKESPLASGNWEAGYGEVRGRFSKERGFAFLAGQYGLGDDYSERKWYFKRLALDFNHTQPALWDVPMNNLATGMAALVAIGYGVYSGRRVEAAWMKPVFLQMEAAMLKNNKIVQMDYSDKGYLYQVMICLAMDLEARSKQASSPEMKVQWKEMGGQVLSTVLHVPPDKVVLGPKGITFK